MATNKQATKQSKKSKHSVEAEQGAASATPAKAPVKSAPGSRSGQPVFGQPQPSGDPKSFSKSVTDKKMRGINQVEPLPPLTEGLPVEPVLTLAQVYGSAGAAKEAAITKAGQLVFHCVGDTGSVTGPTTQTLVADKMVSDFDEGKPADVPSFFFHLGDVVYYFGEATYYYDQFYAPFRNYPAPILAVPGNHDGVVYPNETTTSLAGFLANFCTADFEHNPDAGGLNRTTMIQPAVYFTFETPLARIFGLYSNVLEDPGVISGQEGTSAANTILDSRQVDFLTAGLKRVASEKFKGAVIFAVHHPPFTGGSEHGGSPLMLADMDAACTAAGVWPHAVFSGHAHNYQRFTRTVGKKQIPYIVAGCGGHNPLSAIRTTLRTPYVVDETLTLESYDDTDYGYTRVVVTAETMTIEYHPQSDGGSVKTPDDAVKVNLANYTVS